MRKGLDLCVRLVVQSNAGFGQWLRKPGKCHSLPAQRRFFLMRSNRKSKG
jgi:hypothetical protein